MKKTIICILSATMLFSCKQEKKPDAVSAAADAVKTEMKPISQEEIQSAVIYEANIRQYSAEGTFEAFTKDIPRLKEMGVKILWLMPIYPISETKRKAKGDLFASDIEDPEERKKYLGSYYAVSDFRAVNPEFGTIDDFRKLLKTAHENEIYVILDWVPNHTGWDHVWLKDHPEFYTKNDKGEITDPLNDDGTPVGWADVADLNYDNQELRKTMIADMLYWLEEEGIDGFRCDVAGSVPTDFWEEAIPQLRAKKDIFMLAEAWEPELLKGDLFDMAYGWDTHHRMNDIAQGKETVEAWDKRMESISEMYEGDDILMNFTSNHDENSWNGTVYERMGDAAETFAALSYVAPGMPLIYSGQEYDMDKRLKFFEKDTIQKNSHKFFEVYQKLGALKNSHPALHSGKDPASYTRLKTSDDSSVLAFERKKGEERIVFVANLSKEIAKVKVDFEGKFVNYMKQDVISFSKETDHTIKPWGFAIFVEQVDHAKHGH